MRLLALLGICLFSTFPIAQTVDAQEVKTQVVQHLWDQFSSEERFSMLSKFPDIAVIPSALIGVINSSQLVDRSTSGTNSGAIVGSALGQATYVDRAFNGSGSNYSATAQVGMGILL